MMGKNKFGKYIVLGAVAGAVVSLLDRYTREQVTATSKKVVDEVGFYAKNPDVLKEKVMTQAEKYQSIYEQFSEDASFLKDKVGELKDLSPQVKELVTDTKEALEDLKEQ